MELMISQGHVSCPAVLLSQDVLLVFIREEIISSLLEGIPARIAGSGLQTSESTVCVTC
jgi:hypothetical protein